MLGNPEPENGKQKSANLVKKGVTFKQLQSCGQGSTVLLLTNPSNDLLFFPQVLWILLDANQFWLYDNRESLPSPDENEEEEEESPYSSDEEFEEERGHSENPKAVSHGHEDGDDLYNF